ncbi:MAG: AAA family ATPase [bacterium]|nr:AAA family ATPase [bacterium]
MKISHVTIRNYHQFKDLTLDLTYPTGHPKAGQSLDKVCIIGQSGTGKTSLLHLLRALTDNSSLSSDMTDIQALSHIGGLKRSLTIQDGTLTEKYLNKDVSFSMPKDDGDGHVSLKPAAYVDKEDLLKDYYQNSARVIYFPATLAVNSRNTLQNGRDKEFKDLIGTKNGKNAQPAEESLYYEFFDFSYESAFELWNHSIIKNIRTYRNTVIQFQQKVTNALEKGTDEAQTALDEFKAWKNTTPNPILPYAERLNSILHEFCLEVNTDFTYESEEDVAFIEIKHRAGIDVPFSGWSTGSLQVIFTATPLLQLNTKRSVILMDEPETSLFPDIQEKIIPFYTELAPQAQFFCATHSPIIASCFEPWEVVELRFDEHGYVFRKEYFDTSQDRHVDRYTIDPRYLRWDSLLKKLFDVDEEGHQTRLEGLMELARIKETLRTLKQRDPGNEEALAELWQQYERIAELVDWKLDEKNR